MCNKNAKQFNIQGINERTEIMKRKNWTAPGVDGIQKKQWKMFVAAQDPLK